MGNLDVRRKKRKGGSKLKYFQKLNIFLRIFFDRVIQRQPNLLVNFIHESSFYIEEICPITVTICNMEKELVDVKLSIEFKRILGSDDQGIFSYTNNIIFFWAR